jgi:hypothetical protein
MDKDEMNTNIIIMAQNTNLEAYASANNIKILEQQIKRVNYNKPEQISLLKMRTMLIEESNTSIHPRFSTEELSKLQYAWLCIDKSLRDIAEIKINLDQTKNTLYIWEGTTVTDIEKATVKRLQLFLKGINKKLGLLNLAKKHNIVIPESELTASIRHTYKNIKNPGLRNIRHKIWHNDIFSRKRMMKFNMVTTDSCERCEETETSRHQLFECREARSMWKLYNIIMKIKETRMYNKLV